MTINLVVGLEPNHLSRRDVFVAAIDRVLQTSSHQHRSPSTARPRRELRALLIESTAEALDARRLRIALQASLEQRQRFQQLFFPDGIAFDGKRFVRTGGTAPAFSRP